MAGADYIHYRTSVQLHFGLHYIEVTSILKESCTVDSDLSEEEGRLDKTSLTLRNRAACQHMQHVSKHTLL